MHMFFAPFLIYDIEVVDGDPLERFSVTSLAVTLRLLMITNGLPLFVMQFKNSTMIVFYP